MKPSSLLFVVLAVTIAARAQADPYSPNTVELALRKASTVFLGRVTEIKEINSSERFVKAAAKVLVLEHLRGPRCPARRMDIAYFLGDRQDRFDVGSHYLFAIGPGLLKNPCAIDFDDPRYAVFVSADEPRDDKPTSFMPIWQFRGGTGSVLSLKAIQAVARAHTPKEFWSATAARALGGLNCAVQLSGLRAYSLSAAACATDEECSIIKEVPGIGCDVGVTESWSKRFQVAAAGLARSCRLPSYQCARGSALAVCADHECRAVVAGHPTRVDAQQRSDFLNLKDLSQTSKSSGQGPGGCHEVNLKAIKEMPGGDSRLQDWELNLDPALESIYLLRERAVPCLVAQLEDPTPAEVGIIEFWGHVSIGDLAFHILLQFFTLPSGKPSVGAASFDEIVGGSLDRAAYDRYLEFIEAKGRRALKNHWEKLWRTHQSRLYWDEQRKVLAIRH